MGTGIPTVFGPQVLWIQVWCLKLWPMAILQPVPTASVLHVSTSTLLSHHQQIHHQPPYFFCFFLYFLVAFSINSLCHTVTWPNMALPVVCIIPVMSPPPPPLHPHTSHITTTTTSSSYQLNSDKQGWMVTNEGRWWQIRTGSDKWEHKGGAMRYTRGRERGYEQGIKNPGKLAHPHPLILLPQKMQDHANWCAPAAFVRLQKGWSLNLHKLVGTLIPAVGFIWYLYLP